jgi:hypothetical protein
LASRAKDFEGFVAELSHENGCLIHFTRENQSHLLALRDPPDHVIRDYLLVTLCSQDQRIWALKDSGKT